jgi:hypothetical protein
MRYPRLHSEKKVGLMAVKLAREAIFGEERMKQCTVRGCRGLPPLPHEGLKTLKDSLLAMFPQFWNNQSGFEPLWTIALESVGQCCKRLRL